MKTFFSLFVIGMLSFNSFSQNSTKVLGIWQAKMNGKFMTGTDIGITSAPYSSRFIYYVFSKDKMYFVLAANKTSITSTGIPGMITKQDAMDGTYSVYDSMDLIPEDIRSIALKNAINKEVEKSGGKLVFDADKRTFNIVNANDASMQVSKDGKILDYQTLFPLALQEHKLLDIEVPGGAGNPNPGNPFFVPPTGGQGNEPKIPEYILSSLGSANKAVDFSK
jgi:hypothetical protein